MKLWSLLAVLAAASSISAASAAAPLPCRSETAGVLEEDANGDGKVTLLEARAGALALFEHFDRDRDGTVTRAEAELAAPAWREQRFELRFVALDRDRDGALSRTELALAPRRRARADRDGDGRLTRRELYDAFERGARGGTDTAALRSSFWRRDLNGDRRVTRTEMLVASDGRFMRRDRDGDGVVSSGGEHGSRR